MYLDNDLYQWLMSQIIWYEFGDLKVQYEFKNRATQFNINYHGSFEERLAIKPSYSDIKILDATGLFRKEYLDALHTFETPKFLAGWNNGPTIKITGLWYSAIFAETPILAMLSEHRFLQQNVSFEIDHAERKLIEKIKFLIQHPELKIIEFGTRRRASKEWQKRVLLELIDCTNNIIGTSNVALANEFGLAVKGTQAHQMFMVLEPLYGRIGSQRKVIELWNKYYPNEQIFLTDTYGTKNAMNIISKQELESLKGFRQDSGNPNIWITTVLSCLDYYNIDPKEYYYCFSDNLDCYKALQIYNSYKYILGPIVFGIGTNLTNDMYSAAPNMVIKPNKVLFNKSWQDCYKVSDDPMKATK